MLGHGIFRAAAAFRWDPGNVFVRILDITSLAMHTIGKIDDHFRLARGLFDFHFIDPGRAKSDAGVSVFFSTAFIADAQVSDLEMGRLFFFVSGPGVIDITDFVKG